MLFSTRRMSQHHHLYNDYILKISCNNWLLIEKRIDCALMKLIFNGLNNKNMPENLQLKVSKEKRSLRKNLVMLVHQNENIKPTKYLTTSQMKYEKIFVRRHFQCSTIR